MTFAFRFKLLSALTALVLIFSLAAPMTVYANEPTPEEPTPAAESTPESDSLPEEEVSLSEVVETLAESEAVLLDEEGQEVALTSELAAAALTAPDPIGCPPGVTPLSWGGSGAGCTISYTSIQAAINDVNVLNGWTIYIDPGQFNENVTINKEVTLMGSGNGTDPSQDTIIRSNVGGVVAISANNVKLQNLLIDGMGAASYGIVITTNVQNIELEDITATGATNGLRVGSGISVDGLTVSDSHFDGNSNSGWYIAKESANSSVFNNIDVTNTSFNDNSIKGIYFEKLSNAMFDDIEVINSGVSNTWGFNNGIDINLKWSAYSNITISNSLVQGSGILGGATNPLNASAIAIKARDAGTYGSTPASLSNVLLDNVTVIGGQNGIRFGEPHGANPLQAAIPNAVVVNSSITGVADYGLVNETVGVIDASNNWWGDASGPGGGMADDSTGTIASGSGSPVTGPGAILFDPWTGKTVVVPPSGSGPDADEDAPVVLVLQLPLSGGATAFIPVTGGNTRSLNLDQPGVQTLLQFVAATSFPLTDGAFTCVLKSVTTLTPDQYIVEGDQTITSVGQCSYWVNGVERTLTIALTSLGESGGYDPGDVLLVSLGDGFAGFANSGNPFDANNFMLAEELGLSGKTSTIELEDAEFKQALEDLADVTVPLEEVNGEYSLSCVLEGVTELDQPLELEDGQVMTSMGVCSYLVGGAKHSVLVALTFEGDSGSYAPGQVLALGLSADSVGSFAGSGNPEDLSGMLQPASLDTTGNLE